MVLLVRTRRAHHRTHAWLPTLIGQERSNQSFTVEPVGLDPPRPARDGDRGGINHMAFNLLLEGAVDPKAIQSRLLNNHDPVEWTAAGLRLLLQKTKPFK